MAATLIDAGRGAQQGSVILNRWMQERQASRVSAATEISKIVPGTEMYDVLTGGVSTMAGVHVTPQSAMAVSAVYASVALLGGAVASLPFHVYKREADARKRYESDLWWMFNESPWEEWTAASAWSWAMQSVLLTGVEQQSIGFVRYTLMRHLDRIRQEVNRKVWPRSRLFFAQHALDSLLEGDSKAQSEFIAKALGGPGAQGYMTVNEVRRLKDLPPLPGHDKIAEAGGAAAPQAPKEASEDPPDEDPDQEDQA